MVYKKAKKSSLTREWEYVEMKKCRSDWGGIGIEPMNFGPSSWGTKITKNSDIAANNV